MKSPSPTKQRAPITKPGRRNATLTSTPTLAKNGASATAAFNEGCEQVVLSALMDGRELPVSVDDFSPSHRPIYKAIKSLPCKRRNFVSITAALIASP
jgi:hypothetical protein